MLGPWFGSTTGRRGAMITLDASIAPSMIDAMVASLGGTSPAPIRVAPVEEVFDGTDAYSVRTSGRPSPFVRSLNPVDGMIDVHTVSRSLEGLRTRFGAFQSMFPPSDPTVLPPPT